MYDREVTVINIKRQLPQYVIGLLVLALGAVLLKKAALGMTPILSIPSAVSTVTPLSLGTATMLFHVICWLGILFLRRGIDWKTVLILPLAVVFGWIVDLYMLLLRFGQLSLWMRVGLNLCGIAFTALGIVTIVGCQGVLPAPDALLRTVSVKYSVPLSRVKMAGDAVWVLIAILIDLIFSHRAFLSVGVGTILSVLLTGRLVGVFGRAFPRLNVGAQEKNRTGGKSR